MRGLELPSDGWRLLAADGRGALLRRAGDYLLVAWDADRTLHAASSQSVELLIRPSNEQFLGSTLRASTDYGELKLEF